MRRITFKLMALLAVLVSLTYVKCKPMSWCIRVKLVYNNGFYKAVGGTRNDANGAIQKLISETNDVFRLPGLSFAIELRLVDVIHERNPLADAEWYPGSNAKESTLRKIHAYDGDADVTIFLTDKNYQSTTPGVVPAYGIAQYLTICGQSKEYGSEYTSIVLTHRDEIGQPAFLAYLVASLLGVDSDGHAEQYSPAKEKKKCFKPFAVMSAPTELAERTHWTKCSNEKLKARYQHLVDQNMFCLTSHCGNARKISSANEHKVITTTSGKIRKSKTLFGQRKAKREEQRQALLAGIFG